MSVVAWDGKRIAADRQIAHGDIISKGCKLKQLSNEEIVGWIGGHAAGFILLDWYKSGADFINWPEVQGTEDWSHFIVCKRAGLYHTDNQPVFFKIREKFAAFGSGREIALGAMAAGASAVQAVKITNDLCTTCGLGVDSFSCPRK